MKMKALINITAMNYKKIPALVLLALFFTSTLWAQLYTKKIYKSYRINSTTTVDLFNKYGKVHVITWDTDSVRFEVNLRIQANSGSKLRKMKENISFDFTGNEYYVTAKTRLGPKSGGLFTDLLDIAESFISSENRVTIDYLVFIPKYASLKIENKFGDIYTDDLEGNVDIILSNGDLKSNSFNGNAVIKINAGDAVVNSINKGRLLVSYSDFHIKNANKLNVESRSSRISIDRVNFLKINSRRDKLYIPLVDNLYGESYFSDFTIQKLNNELNYNFKYGNLSIEVVSKSFSFININSEYTDLYLIFEKESSYELDISHHQDVVLNYPARIAKTEEKVLNQDEKLLLTYGRVGYRTSSSKLKINAPRKCIVNIIHK
jgi:hypothetical protein